MLHPWERTRPEEGPCRVLVVRHGALPSTVWAVPRCRLRECQSGPLETRTPLPRSSKPCKAVCCLPFSSGWEVPAVSPVLPVSSDSTSPFLSRVPSSSEDASCLQSTQQEDRTSERGADFGMNSENQKHGWLFKRWLTKSLILINFLPLDEL